jgi:hypothetical protein
MSVYDRRLKQRDTGKRSLAGAISITSGINRIPSQTENYPRRYGTLRPAVVMVNAGSARLIRRETYDDLPSVGAGLD